MNRNNFVVFVFITFVLLTAILISSCKNTENSTEPNESTSSLIIENGYYNRVETTDTNQVKYVVQFSYYVKGDSCAWGGYRIKMDSQTFSYSLNKFPNMEPGKRYERSDTFNVVNVLNNDPLVSISGYQVIDAQHQLELYAEYLLQRK